MHLERQIPSAAHWSREHYQSMLAEAEGLRLPLVIEDQSTVAGLLIARRAASEWEIENIFVALPVRRRGFASQLLRTFLHTARQNDAHSVFLEVRESNQPARSLYERWGFKQTGRRRSYYREPEEDAITYRFLF